MTTNEKLREMSKPHFLAETGKMESRWTDGSMYAEAFARGAMEILSMVERFGYEETVSRLADDSRVISGRVWGS